MSNHFVSSQQHLAVVEQAQQSASSSNCNPCSQLAHTVSNVFRSLHQQLYPCNRFVGLNAAENFFTKLRTRHQLLAAWKEWEAKGDPEENRAQAVHQLKNWLKKNEVNQFLDLSNLNLKRLPQLPEHLELLDVSHNQLTRLPILPKTLHALNICNNRLNLLPALPPNLYSLQAANNQLISLPELPATLEILDVSNNWLGSLPPQLSNIKEFYAEGATADSSIRFPASVHLR